MVLERFKAGRETGVSTMRWREISLGPYNVFRVGEKPISVRGENWNQPVGEVSRPTSIEFEIQTGRENGIKIKEDPDKSKGIRWVVEEVRGNRAFVLRRTSRGGSNHFEMVSIIQQENGEEQVLYPGDILIVTDGDLSYRTAESPLVPLSKVLMELRDGNTVVFPIPVPHDEQLHVVYEWAHLMWEQMPKEEKALRIARTLLNPRRLVTMLRMHVSWLKDYWRDTERPSTPIKRILLLSMIPEAALPLLSIGQELVTRRGGLRAFVKAARRRLGLVVNSV